MYRGSMPSKLYKYYSNKVIDGIIYSKEALENNTVYLQEIRKFDDKYRKNEISTIVD